MSDRAEIHVGDVGTVFRATIRDDAGIVDLGAASSLKFVFRKPSGVVVEKDAQVTTSGADGQMEYIAEADLLDQEGVWRLQGVVATGAGEWHSEQEAFRVYPNLA